MTNIFDRRVGLRSDNRPLLAIVSAAGPVTPLRTSRFTIDAIRRRLGPRASMILPHCVEVPGPATRLSLVSSAAADTSGGSTLSSTSSGSRPDTDEPPQGYKRLRFRLRSVSPLVMHSGRLANPLDPMAKAMKKISGKRAKTDADFVELARLEFLGGLYLHKGAPCIPGEVMEAALIEAAKKARRGAQAKAGIVCDGFFPLEYEGPSKPDDLWEDERFRLSVGVRVQKNRVQRMRPIFREWASTITVDFMPGELNGGDVEEMVSVAGMRIGLMDWRPRFGRFMAERL